MTDGRGTGSAGGAEEAVREDVQATARRVAERVRALPDVVDLSSGAFGTTATPGPDGRVDGVAVRDAIEVGVVVRYGRPLPEVTDEVRAAAAEAVDGGRTVHVRVEDVVAGA